MRPATITRPAPPRPPARVTAPTPPSVGAEAGVALVGLAAGVLALTLLAGPWRLVGLAGAGLGSGSLILGLRQRVDLVPAVPAAIVGLALGVGIGLRHLQLDGVSATSVAGIVALGSGLWLAGALVRRGWRRATVGRRILVAGAVPAAMWFVLWPLSVALMAASVPPIAPARDVSPADVGLVAQDVRFTARDGVELAAWYVPSANGAGVVLRHGASSTRASVLDQAAVLARHGYGVLATDARGHGDSGGHAMALGWYGDLDIEAAVDFLAVQPDVDAERIAVMGLSMGGEEALGAAARLPVAAVVAEGASGRTLADDDLTLPTSAVRWLNVARDWITFTVTDWLTGADRPTGLEDAVQATAPRPVLLITGLAAAGGEVTAGRRLAAAGDHVSLWEVPGAGHTEGLATAPQAWEQRVVTFLDGALRPDQTGGCCGLVDTPGTNPT